MEDSIATFSAVLFLGIFIFLESKNLVYDDSNIGVGNVRSAGRPAE